MVSAFTPPPAIRDLWPTPPLGDWAVRDMQNPVPIAGGDGFAPPKRNNLGDRDTDDSNGGYSGASPDSTDYGVGQPVDTTTSPAFANYRAPRGRDDEGAYSAQKFLKVLNHVVTHSLGRESLYNWADAQFNVGGVGYPRDYGFGPGYHGDATLEMGNVQIYMRPGIWRGAQPTPGQHPTAQMLYPTLFPTTPVNRVLDHTQQFSGSHM